MEAFLHLLEQIQTQHLDLFTAIGQNLVRGLAVIMVAWFGVETSLNSSSFAGGFKFDKFIRLIFLISFAYFMVNEYTEFVRIITGMGDYLAIKINNEIDYNTLGYLSEMYYKGEIKITNFLNVAEGLVLVLVWALSLIARAIAFVVIAFGYVVRLVLVLVGPIFIPFILVPQLKWLFTGWLKALVQYSFYSVIANLVVYVVVSFYDAKFVYQDATVKQLVASFPQIMTVLLAGIYAILKIPKIVNHIFSGMSGL